MPANAPQRPAPGAIVAVVVVFRALARIVAVAARLARRSRPAQPVQPMQREERRPQLPRPGWSMAQPEHLVQPTYWPMVLALGIAFLLWGLVSSLIISGIGLILFVLALANWIGELRNET